MAIVTIPRVHWPPISIGDAATMSFGITGIIDAANEKQGCIFRISKTGSVTHIRWGTRTVTTGGTVDVRLETVDLTTEPAVPSGTLWGTTTNGSQVVNSADDNVQFETALTLPAAVTAGDLIASVISNPGVSFGNMQVSDVRWVRDTADNYVLLNTGSWAVLSSRGPNISLKYDDGLYYPLNNVWPSSAINLVSFNNTSTPDVRGIVFQVPVSVRVRGGWFQADLDGAATLRLFDSDGVTVLRSRAIGLHERMNANVGVYDVDFSDGVVTLLANTSYRLVLEPTSATNIGLNDFDVASSAIMAAMFTGNPFNYTSAKDPSGTGSWTDVNTKWAPFGLVVDGVDSGGGGGGTIFTGMVVR